MNQEYTISAGWKIFMICVAVFLMVFSLFLFSLGQGKAGPYIFLLPTSILLGSIWLILQQVRKKIIISDDSIIRVDAFSTMEIFIKDIKGCRVGQKVIYIEPISSVDNIMIINNYDVLKNSDELAKYLRDNFKDADAIDLKEEQEKALNDPALGFSQQDREDNLKKAKQVAIAYNITSVILTFGSIFLDNSIDIILLLIYPLLGIIIMFFSKGLIKFLSNRKRSVYAYITPGIFLPSFISLIKALSDYDLYQYKYYCLLFLGLSLIVFTLLYMPGINKTVASVKAQAIIMLIAALIYTGGSVTQINCTFDNTPPNILHTAVVAKDMEYSKGNHYYLTLAPWDGSSKTQHIEVSRSFYSRKLPGDYVNVNMKKGVLGIPWFYLTR